jgi:hypothetical protein
MSINDHPSLSGMTPEERAEYTAFARFAGREVNTPERSAMSTEEMVYIDRDGLYGDATGLLIVKLSDFGDGGRAAFEKAKDECPDLLTWVTGYLLASGKDVSVTLVSKTSKLFSSGVTGNSKGILKRLRGRK